jgi:hypothetical protein
MKNPLHYLQEYPHRTQSILGISNEQFQALLKQAKSYDEEQRAIREEKKIRLNQKGGGRKPKLNLAEEVCLCLYYLRQMPTFEVLGMQFGISKTEANDTIDRDHRLLWDSNCYVSDCIGFQAFSRFSHE